MVFLKNNDEINREVIALNNNNVEYFKLERKINWNMTFLLLSLMDKKPRIIYK